MTDYSWIPATVLGVTAIISAVAGIVIMYNKHQDTLAVKARENSTGALAIESLRADNKKLNDQIENLKEQIDDMRKEYRETAREYLDTLKQLASRFKS